MLLYRGMDIGTAKPVLKNRRGIQHHLIDILDPGQNTVSLIFRHRLANLSQQSTALARFQSSVGGTGLYIKALLEGYRFNAVPASDDLRQLSSLFADPTAAPIFTNCSPAFLPKRPTTSPQRFAPYYPGLEIHHLSGETMSQRKAFSGGLVYDAAVFGLTMRGIFSMTVLTKGRCHAGKGTGAGS